ncbi:MAG: S8 family serine peptidase [Burkholderiaceae bacterium]
MNPILGNLPRALRFGIVAVAIACAFAVPVGAQTSDPIVAKLSNDLSGALSVATGPVLPWLRQVGGESLVKVIVSTSPDDTLLPGLVRYVLSLGGAVHYTYPALNAMAVMMPASKLLDLAGRSEVLSISADRPVMRSASQLQLASGAAQVPSGGLLSTPLDGSGIGIAVLDSGVAWNHQNMAAPSLLGLKGPTRVRQALDFHSIGKAWADAGWKKGSDETSLSLNILNGLSFNLTLKTQQLPVSTQADAFGHGTHVASIAAGQGGYQWPDSSGIAPKADVYDVRVLGADGLGTTADVLAGIDWVIQRAKLMNIRVMNLSLAADSTESFVTDPLARAARAASNMGIVVVVASGNNGLNADGRLAYGVVGSPGHGPSAITVGAANLHDTVARSDDSVTRFSSRGPNRGRSTIDGTAWVDNLVKPDLVAPGNAVVGALGADVLGYRSSWNFLAKTYPQLSAIPGAAQAPNQTLMELSGTSVAAPVVSGAVALLLQANPGLTPPLVKAILQYTAQPLANSNLLEQGAGLLNIEGAVQLARALRTDIGPALEAGRMRDGDALLARGKSLPLPRSTLNGQTFNWGRLVTAGGSHLLSGDALFTRFQPFYDPTLTWARSLLFKSTVTYWPLTLNTVPRSIVERASRPTRH